MNTSIKEILNSDDPYYEIEFYYGGNGVPTDDEKLCKEIAHKIESNSLENKMEKDNCYAELASHIEMFRTEFKNEIYDILNNFSELKEPLSLGDRIERFVWLNQLIQRIYELENKTPNESINKKIEELEKARDFIEYQLGISSKNNEFEINQNYPPDNELSQINNPRANANRNRELKQGMREIWIKEGEPEMKDFFPSKLKKYINRAGSPITEVYTAGKDAGFAFKLSTGTTGTRAKKTLSNWLNEFKNNP